jgi:hypothetical protein
MGTQSFSLSCIVLFLLAGCTTTSSANKPDFANTLPFAGLWQMPDTKSAVLIELCNKKSKKYCGKTIAFDGKNTKRDFKSSDPIRWGNRICNSTALMQIKETDNTHKYTALLYYFRSGKTLKVDIQIITENKIDVTMTPENSLHARINMAIEMATEGPLSIVSGMLIDKGMQVVLADEKDSPPNQTGIWHRINYDIQRCDRPVIQTMKDKK